MSGIDALAVLAGLIAVATAAGLVWRARSGRVRSSASGLRIVPSDVGAASFGPEVTLLQFSTAFCSPCRSTARVLHDVAATRPGAEHVDVDLTDRPDLARRYNVLQTPTTFILDGSGLVRARIGGAVRPADVRSALTEITGSIHASS